MGPAFSIVNVNPKFVRKATENIARDPAAAGWFVSGR
jgi:hypothetical protein